MIAEAKEIVAEIERLGGAASVIGSRLAVKPAEIVTPELLSQLKASFQVVIAYLRESRPAAPRCALMRIPAWRSDLAVRVCHEPGHWHEPFTAEPVVFDQPEIDVLLAWASATGERQLSPAVREMILELKLTFGGRIDPETIERLCAAR